MSAPEFAHPLFAHPDWLPWLGAVAGLAIAGVGLAAVRGARRLRRLGRASAGIRGARRVALSDAALCCALLALVAAAVGPRLSHRDVLVSRSGADVVLLFDVSRSMDAQDDPPSRIDRARRSALAVLATLAPGSRAALAAFASRGVLLTPLSPDVGALSELVTAIDTDLVRPRGSDLADGLRAALDAFEPGSDRSRVLLVLSDGEIRPRISRGDLSRLANAGVRVVAVALGSPLGATIPDGSVPLRDRDGEIAVTRRVLDPLETLARASDGEVFVANAWGDVDVPALVAAVERDARAAAARPGGEITRRVRTPTVVPFAALAFALLAGEALASGRPRTSRSRTRRATAQRAVAAAAVAASLLGLGASTGDEPTARVDALESIARRRPLHPDELIELGVARFDAGRSDEARRVLHAAALEALRADRPDWAAVAYHDLGVDALGRRDLEAARDFFLEAVALAPDQRRSRFNLEWTLRALASPESPPPTGPGSEPPESKEGKPPGSTARDQDDTARRNGAAHPLPGESGPAGPPPGDAAESAIEAAGSRREERAPGAHGEPGTRAPLDAAEQSRWLARVADDPARALRSAANDGSIRHARRGGGPEW